ncbi:AcrR family transcriptional regulator [Actinotalea ferrariae CF5-4]|uniref:AcrR family transcriptional regulator n=1 Tax=Actinotalea ferrariae CF5-4 TaxID=948458 RepID=A0A021VN08_9CELL|nr:TetR/AcrR family transcriptional regulator C-terminal domain-containing protein [Actinotalea ferrariae]EYR62488.1 AcrR family transcriptional regulator [Actinotalea ferrariae CF5-4]
MPAGTRTPLSRERIVDAAIALADDKGVEGLTMRALGRALGVEAMSLYHHVPNRDDVLDGVVDRIYAEFYAPVVGGDWKDELRRRSHSARAVIRRHPWVIPLMNARSTPGLSTLAHLDAVIGVLRSAGFSLPMTAHAFALVDAHLYGFLAQEVSLPISPGQGVQEIADGIAETTDMAEHFPHLAELVAGHALQPGYDFGDEFEYGLELVLEGLERDLRTDEGGQ